MTLDALHVLAPFQPRFFVRLAAYSAGRAVAEDRREILPTSESFQLTLPPNVIGCQWTTSPVAGSSDAMDLTLDAQHHEGWGIEGGGIGIQLELGRWSRQVYVLAPGSVYAGNRFQRVTTPSYPPIVGAELRQPDGNPLVTTSILGLALDDGPSAFALKAGEMTTPALAWYDPQTSTGAILLFAADSAFGETAIRLEESPQRDHATITLLAPGIREGQRNSNKPGLDRFDVGHGWNLGHRVRLQARLHAFPCFGVTDLFQRFAEVRRSLSGTPQAPTCLPFSAAYELLASKRLHDNWNEGLERFDPGLPSPGHPSSFQLGWCGGMLDLLPLLRSTDPAARPRVMRALNRFFIPENHSPAGFWKDMWKGDQPDTEFPGISDCWFLVRRHGDALFALAKVVLFLRREDPAWKLPQAWAISLRREGEALATLWRCHGAFGQWVDGNTGQIIIGDTSSGALVPGALALAGVVLDEPSWRPLAELAGERFAHRELAQGFANGGPGDHLQAPDSEAAFSLVETFATLHALTGEARWAEWGSQAVDQASSWVMTRDHHFPAASPLGQINARTTGTVFANAQNRHSAPGICTLSGDGLLRIFRATGEARHLDLLRDIARALPQFVSRPAAPIANLGTGWVNERVNTCDWEACWLRSEGDVFKGSCWPEVSLLQTIVEVPGIYVRTDLKRLWTIDHVEADILSINTNGVRLRITNPTAMEAQVRVLVEDLHAAAEPLPFDALSGVPVVRIAPGESLDVTLCVMDHPPKNARAEEVLKSGHSS